MCLPIRKLWTGSKKVISVFLFVIKSKYVDMVRDRGAILNVPTQLYKYTWLQAVTQTKYFIYWVSLSCNSVVSAAEVVPCLGKKNDWVIWIQSRWAAHCSQLTALFCMFKIWNAFTGVCTNLWIVTVSFIMSVCLSLRRHVTIHWTDFHEIWYLSILGKCLEKFRLH
jgi:hypothetical protein